MFRIFQQALLISMIVAIAGCSSDRRAPVTGKITVEGKGPLPGGSIRFVSVSNPDRFGSGIIHSDGTYKVADAPVGECKVVIDNSHLDKSARKKTGAGMPIMAPIPGKKGPMMPSNEQPKELAAKTEGGPPKGTDLPSNMPSKSEIGDQQFLRIDPGFASPDSTSLKASVKKGTNTLDFAVN